MTDLTLINISSDDTRTLTDFASKLGWATGYKYDIAARGDTVGRFVTAQAFASDRLGIACLSADNGISVAISSSLKGNDNVDIRLPGFGAGLGIRQRGRESFAAYGQAAVSVTSEPCSIVYSCEESEAASRQIRVAISRSLLQDYVRSSDCLVAALLDDEAGYLSLFDHYARALVAQAGRLAPSALDVAARQMAELAALAIGPNARAIEAARAGALSRARLSAARNFVAQNLSDPLLNEDKIAAHVRISVGQLRKDFEREGFAVARYLRDQRLDRAKRILSEKAFEHVRIIDVAFQCGFRDISTFNRAFRRRFAMTPSDLRGE